MTESTTSTAVGAVAAALQTDAANITTALTALENLIVSLNNNEEDLSPETLAALQAAQAAVDAVAATAASDVATDTPAPGPSAEKH